MDIINTNININQQVIVTFVESANEFLQQTEIFRNKDSLSMNLINTISFSYSKRIIDEKCWWWIIRDINSPNEVIGIAVRTGPRALVLSKMPLYSIKDLAKKVSEEDDSFPSINGPVDVVNTFLEEYSKTLTNGSTRKPKLRIKLLLHEVKTFIEPQNIRGYCRKVTNSDEDIELAVKLLKLFFIEADIVSTFDILNFARAKIEEELFYFWIDTFDDGAEVVVAFGGHNLIIPDPNGEKGIGRVGPIYTCENYRCRGYAGFLTAFITSKLLQSNSRAILFTDAANPTSNGVYRRLGYEVVGDSIEYDLVWENEEITS